MSKLLDPNVIEDSGWKTAPTGLPHRGIHDYMREVTFRNPPTEEELTKIAYFLHTNKCPGYTGVYYRGVGTKYTFLTTYDSSD